jgi:RNA polymerase sigma-70 factor (ECF subfamily)
VQEGRSHAEISEILGTSVAAVKARLHRAREQLREHYQP